MKQFTILSFFMLFLLGTSFQSQAAVNHSPDLGEYELSEGLEAHLSSITAEDILSLTPKKIKEATGQKLSIKETIALKAMQKKLKKGLKNGTITNGSMGKGLYIFLAIIGLGFIGLGVNTDWSGNDWIIALVLGLFTCLGGMIFTLVKMKDHY